MLKVKWIFLFLPLAFLLSACGNQLFDKEEIYGVDERIADMSKGSDLLNAMDKAKIKKTILLGSYDAGFNRTGRPDWASSERSNRMLLEAKERAPERIEFFPLIRGDEDRLLDYAKQLVSAGARGFQIVNGETRFRLMPLTDARLRPLYEWCELNRLSIHLDIEYDRYAAEFEQLLRDYPNLFFVVSGLLGLSGDLERLGNLLDRYPNLFLDFSFGFEPEKLQALENLAKNRAAARRMLIENKERFLFATNIRIASAAGRNLDWLNEYFVDARLFLERRSLRLKLLLDGQPTIRRLDGLKLPTETLEFIYHHNFNNIIPEHPAEYSKYNLDKLLATIPPGATYDEKAPYRLVTALVVPFTNTAEGVFSTFFQNVLNGTVTSWKELTGVNQRVRLVAMAPLERWVPARLKIDRPVPIEVVPNAEALLALMAQDPGVLAMVPFDQLRPEMKVMQVDGETPTGRYVRDCAKRGGATVGTYFHSYPLLVPLAVPQKPPVEMVYEPYQLRSVILSGGMLPAVMAGRAVGDVQPATDAVFELGNLLREADLALTAIESPLTADCVPQDRQLCTNRAWLGALDFTGIDIVAALGRHLNDFGPAALTDTLNLYRRHSVQAFQAGAPNAALMQIRGRAFTFLGYDAGYLASWAPETMQQEIKQALADDALVFVYFYQDENSDSEALVKTAQAAIDAGAQAAIITGRFAPRGMTLYRGRIVARGLGNLSLAGSDKPGTDLAFLARHVFYRDRLISIDLVPLQAKSNTVQITHGTTARKAFALLFGGM